MSWHRYFPNSNGEYGIPDPEPIVVEFPRGNTLVEPDQIFIHDLVLDASIGIYESELTATQPVKFNIALDVTPIGQGSVHDEDNIVCYDTLCQGIRSIVEKGHIGLVETLAEQVAELCLKPSRARKVSVSIAKPNAIAEAQDVGIRIVRSKNEI